MFETLLTCLLAPAPAQAGPPLEPAGVHPSGTIPAYPGGNLRPRTGCGWTPMPWRTPTAATAATWFPRTL